MGLSAEVRCCAQVLQQYWSGPYRCRTRYAYVVNVHLFLISDSWLNLTVSPPGRGWRLAMASGAPVARCAVRYQYNTLPARRRAAAGARRTARAYDHGTHHRSTLTHHLHTARPSDMSCVWPPKGALPYFQFLSFTCSAGLCSPPIAPSSQLSAPHVPPRPFRERRRSPCPQLSAPYRPLPPSPSHLIHIGRRSATLPAARSTFYHPPLSFAWAVTPLRSQLRALPGMSLPHASYFFGM